MPQPPATREQVSTTMLEPISTPPKAPTTLPPSIQWKGFPAELHLIALIRMDGNVWLVDAISGAGKQITQDGSGTPVSCQLTGLGGSGGRIECRRLQVCFFPPHACKRDFQFELDSGSALHLEEPGIDGGPEWGDPRKGSGSLALSDLFFVPDDCKKRADYGSFVDPRFFDRGIYRYRVSTLGWCNVVRVNEPGRCYPSRLRFYWVCRIIYM